MTDSASLLDVRDLSCSFGETRALDSCSLTLSHGEIHALVGENGSGKSTLIKILSGVIAPNSGALLWGGRTTRFANPAAAQAAGVATVFQETLVLDDMSVRDNMMLGLDGVVRRRVSRSQEAIQVRGALSVVGLDALDIDRLTGSLSLAHRQLVGIARSLLRPWRLLVLDESTSALDVEDRDRLFKALRGFRDDGRTILFVSHRMDEIETLADRITVLRSGRMVATLTAAEASTERLLELMSTREGAQAAEGHAASRRRPAGGDPVLTIRDFALVAGRPLLNLSLRAGEIVGVGGLEGHGQEAFLECVAGRRSCPSGGVSALGGPVRSPREAKRSHIAFLPRDRKTEGIFAPLSVTDNVTISALRSLSRWGFIGAARRREVASALCLRAKVKAASLEIAMASLSGGNQQKALLARLMATSPRVLVLNDPLRGVDLGAKRDLYQVLIDLAAGGLAIVLLSTELVELCLLCDRVVVFHRQAASAVIEREDLDERRLIAAMFGKSSESERGAA